GGPRLRWAVRTLPWYEERGAQRASTWPCCRARGQPRLLPCACVVAMRVPAPIRHCAQQPRAGVRRKLAGAGEHEEVSPWQRENVYESQCTVDGVFARVVCCGHGAILA